MSVEDPAQLVFRTRPAERPRPLPRLAPHSAWVVIAMVAALGFVLLVRTMIVRSAWTAGRSSDVAESSRGLSDSELAGLPTPGVPVSRRVQAPAPRRPVLTSAPPAGQGVVFRCVGAGGAVALQSQPCPADERTTRVVGFDRAMARPGASPSLYRSPDGPSGVSGRAPVPAQDGRRARCEAQRRHRDEVLAHIGLARTYDLLRALDEAVYEACKGL